MSGGVSKEYVADVLNEMVNEGRPGVEVLSEVEQEHWPLSISEIVERGDFSQDDNAVHLSLEAFEHVTDYQLERRNATGGLYADIDQHVALDATLQLEADGGEKVIPEAGSHEIDFFCEVSTNGEYSVEGEKPPF